MEFKWIMIAVAVSFSALMAPMVVDKYASAQCRIAYTQSTKTAEEISKICR